MKKIGILTFHYAHNYGAVLQAYALKFYLENIGHDVSIIDYKNQIIEDYHKVFNIRRLIAKNPFTILKINFIYWMTLSYRKKRFLIFNEFIESQLAPVSISQMHSFNYFILGSDQIWNKRLTGGLDAMYWAAFDKHIDQKVISYAASMEAQILSPDETHTIKSYLSQIDYISVREDRLQKQLSELTDKDVNVVLDPTLLIDKQHWYKFSKRPKFIPKDRKYILLYMANKDVREYANKMASDLNMEIIDLPSGINCLPNSRTFMTESPEEFVGWFKEASYILTTSFHGLAFSIIFEKPFYVIDRAKNPNMRAYALLNELGISDRLCKSPMKHTYATVDYQSVNDKLYNLQQKSRDFLKKALM